MSSIFENIYLPKDKRKVDNYFELTHDITDSTLAQYREKVKAYSSYAIGRKIPKNTPKYTDFDIQCGVFFVKAPSILRIITKWVEELYELVTQAGNKYKATNKELKTHEGHSINMSSRVKRLLFQKLH
jgi:hypothetical protein